MAPPGPVYPPETFAFEHLADFGEPGCEIYGPWAALIEGPDGRLYGTATGTRTIGGTSDPFNSGAVFAINRDGTGCQVLHRFTGYLVNRDGKKPLASLVLGPGGYLYGTTSEEGATPNGFSSANGTVFRVRPDGTDYRVIHTILTPTGGAPSGKLILGPDGKLYGTASTGGAGSGGIVYRLTEVALPLGGSSFNFEVLHDFQNRTTGSLQLYTPYAGLESGGDGWFYGTCANGGQFGSGGVYRVNPAGIYQEIYAPTTAPRTGPGVAANLQAGLFRASDGAYYGFSNDAFVSNATGGYGGTFGYGAFFRTALAGGLWRTTVLRNATTGADLQRPSIDMRMVEGPDGRLYGTAPSGSDGSSQGGVFVTTRDGAYFQEAVRFRDRAPTFGQAPRGGLVLARDGWLYGTTSRGGARGGGTLFRLRPNRIDFPIQLDVVSVTQGANRDASTPGAAPVEYQLESLKDTLVRVQPFTLGLPSPIISAGLRVVKRATPDFARVDVNIDPAGLPSGPIAGFAAGVFSGAPTLDFWVPAAAVSSLGRYSFTLYLRVAGSPLALYRVPLVSQYFSPGPDLAVMLFPASLDLASDRAPNAAPWGAAHRRMLLGTLLEVARLLPVKSASSTFARVTQSGLGCASKSFPKSLRQPLSGVSVSNLLQPRASASEET